MGHNRAVDLRVVRAGAATDVGLVRNVNQDRILVTDRLYAVADGMGGHAGGEVAARMAVDTLRSSFEGSGGERELVDAFLDANHAVLEQSRSDASLRGMGTTLTAVAVVPGEDRRGTLVLAHVGDSRGYLFSGGELSQITGDHSLVAEMVRSGELNPAEASGHPHRHIVTRALGVDDRLEVDSWQLTPAEGDRILLCSDGLVNEVDDETIASVLGSVEDPEEAAGDLVRLAREHGGSDNITVVVLDLGDDDHDGPGVDSAPTSLGAVDPAPTRTGDEPEPLTRAVPVVRPPGPRAQAGPSGATPRAQVRPPRRITFRVVLFIAALALVAAGGVAAIYFYARGGYFVGLSGNRIVVYRGRPGGVLGWKPTIASRTGYTTGQVPGYALSSLRQGTLEPDQASAHAYVCNLVSEAAAVGAAAAPSPIGYCASTPTTLAGGNP